MKGFVKFLKTDVKIINSYFLLLVILIILVCVGYSSYALFSFSKTSTNIIEGTVGKIKKSAAVELIKLTDNKDESGLYTITHAADSTLQIGATEDITEYRYRGANPKNYVTFNNEVWRIIGVFKADDGTGKIENRIKLIRNESIGNKYWNTSGTNNWARPASLNTYLNGTYYNGISSEAQSMIGNAKYYLGGYTSTGITASNMYLYERKISGSGTYYHGTNPNSWTGKIALMYVSDYGYAASDACSQTMSYYDECKNENWLYNSNTIRWTLSQFIGYGIVFRINSSGRLEKDYGDVSDYLFGVQPVLYLTSSVQITGGSGTSADPYTLGI